MPNIEVTTSVHNLPRSVALTGNAIDYATFLHAAGSRGFQYMPVRTLHKGLGETMARYGMIRSLHQSWFNMHSIKDTPLAVVLPSMERSLKSLERVQRAGSKHYEKLPVVVHPAEQHLGGKPQRKAVDYNTIAESGTFGPLLHQPTVEVLSAWKVLSNDADATAEAMLEAQAAKGFGGVALDLYHLTAERAHQQFDIGWCENFVGSLAARGALAEGSEVQLSFRPDFGDEWSNLFDAEQGRLRETPQGRLLTAINEALPAEQTDLRLTMEFGASVFKPLNMDPALGNRIIADEARQLLA